ncbi:unnamed protein product [Leptosia nina]|uniref:ZAD domain-containing protein n=1 Tax=Leptosia nina TaxID=320188 RepID=A0AAV1K1G3_9NEOP
MSATSSKGPVIDPGLCRCCGSMKKCRVLNVEYSCFGKKEVYSDMIMDCFGLLLSHLDSLPTERLVCASCVHKIRDAYIFRQQVLKCEEAFLQAKIYDNDDVNDVTSTTEQSKIKVKDEILEDDIRSPSPCQDILEDMPLSVIKKETSSSNNIIKTQETASDVKPVLKSTRLQKKQIVLGKKPPPIVKSKYESDQPPAKKAKSLYDTPSSHQTQQSSQGSQNIIIETGHHQDQLNTRHTINVIVNNNKKERQKRYREQNRDKLKQREAERRECIQHSQIIAGPSTSSKTNRIELNNEEIITAQSSSGSEKIQPSSIQRNDQGTELNALQKKRERQQRYREQNRDKLKQREAKRRERIQHSQSIAGPSTSSKTNRIELNNEEIITAQSSSGSEKIQPSSIQRNDQGTELNALQKKKRTSTKIQGAEQRQIEAA